MNIRPKQKKPHNSHKVRVVSPTARPGQSVTLGDRLIQGIK